MRINYVIGLITDNYPVNYSANNSKFSLLARALRNTGHKVSIINTPWCKSNKKQDQICYDNDIPVVTWESTSDAIVFSKLSDFLSANYEENNKNIFITSYLNFIRLQKLISICHKNKYKIGFVYQEWHKDLELSIKGKVNAFILDNYLLKRFDFILPISEFLLKLSVAKNPFVFKLPIIYDYSAIGAVVPNSKPLYFAYCASIAYWQVIKFVIRAFCLMRNQESNLKLIINGSDKDRQLVYQYVLSQGGNDRIQIMHSLTTEQLNHIFCNSSALLIPLQSNYKPDVARFSQKIAEYLASGKPIVTTNVGEIPIYFEDRKNAYITTIDELQFSNILDEILSNTDCANTIGIAGRELGIKEFDSKKIATNLSLFISGLG